MTCQEELFRVLNYMGRYPVVRI